MTRIKLLPVRVGLASLLIALTILGPAKVPAADWKLLGSDDGFSYFYDSTSISYPSKNIGKVWTKTVYKEKGRAQTLEAFRDNRELLNLIKNVDHTVNLFEIDCPEKKFRTLSGVFYSKSGKVLKTIESTSGTWKSIPPDTIYEALHELVCK